MTTYAYIYDNTPGIELHTPDPERPDAGNWHWTNDDTVTSTVTADMWLTAHGLRRTNVWHGDDFGEAGTGMSCQVELDEDALADAARDYAATEAAHNRAKEHLRNLTTTATRAGMSEVETAKRAGISRITLRRWLDK